MGHRKWVKARSWREFHADDMIAEHNALYDAWVVEGDRADDLLKDRNAIQQKLDAARKRIAELESPTRVPFSDAQIERMAEAYYEARWDTGKWARLSPNDQASTKSAIRAALAAGGLEPCPVPEYDPADVALRPADDEVEKLARAIWKSYENLYCRSGVHMIPFEENRVAWFTQSRAAIAHLAKRPEGLPTAEELAKISYDASPSLAYMGGNFVKWEKLSDGQRNIYTTRADAILTALRPWLRDPVGWELDVTLDEMCDVYCNTYSGTCRDDWQAVLDLCRSRIRPVFECKECAKADEANHELCSRIEAARAALEGE